MTILLIALAWVADHWFAIAGLLLAILSLWMLTSLLASISGALQLLVKQLDGIEVMLMRFQERIARDDPDFRAELTSDRLWNTPANQRGDRRRLTLAWMAALLSRPDAGKAE